MMGNKGLCVAKMVPIAGPDGGPNWDYKIDSTEVTKGQYDAWLATSPSLPPSTDVNCGYVASYVDHDPRYTGPDADHHPVVGVDWCDAYKYCLGVDKRLCGAIGGGPDYAGYDDVTQSQWYRACTSGGTNTYPYGNTYQSSYCNGADYWNNDSSSEQTTAVGSLRNCVTGAVGYAGIYDLSGNVAEWEDSCQGVGSLGICHIRGGFFSVPTYYLTCRSDDEAGRTCPYHKLVAIEIIEEITRTCSSCGRCLSCLQASSEPLFHSLRLSESWPLRPLPCVTKSAF